jgi:polyribonucleotide nucleotidyltransferase
MLARPKPKPESGEFAPLVDPKGPNPGKASTSPPTVDYREPVFSAGKIPGGWFKREGKQTTKETLIFRLLDRPLRPLFEEGYNGDTMITVQFISFDGEHQPDTLATPILWATAVHHRPITASPKYI